MNQAQRVMYVAGILCVAVSLSASLAHLLALPNKLALSEHNYFVVQQIYRGWALLGVVVVAALLLTGALLWMVRSMRRARRWAWVAFICLAAAQLSFWLFTQPANLATGQWTFAPHNWRILREQWELSHAAGALLNLGALLALVLSLLASSTPLRHERV